MSGWIKLHRNLLEWEWYDDINATRLLVHFLVSVNYEEKIWKGIKVMPGQIIFSWETLSKATGLTLQQLRTSISRLENSREINREVTAKYQVVTLVKWDKLQGEEKKVTGKQQQKQQASNRPATTTKEDKKDTNVSKEVKNVYRAFAHLELSEEDFLKLQDAGFLKNEIDDVLNRIENYKKNTNYKSLYLTALTWLKSDREKAKKNGTNEPRKSTEQAVRDWISE